MTRDQQALAARLRNKVLPIWRGAAEEAAQAMDDLDDQLILAKGALGRLIAFAEAEPGLADAVAIAKEQQGRL